MFCNKCGSAMDAAAERCPQCGAASASSPRPSPSVYAQPAVAYYVQSKLARRLPILATLWVIYGVLEALRAAAVQFFAHISRNWLYTPLWSEKMGTWVMGWVAMWLFLGAVLAFIAAWGLYERLPWGRSVAIVAAFVGLLHPPLGLFLGIYTLVLLLSRDAADEYARTASA